MGPLRRTVFLVLGLFAFSLFGDDRPYLVRDLGSVNPWSSIHYSSDFLGTGGNVTWFHPAGAGLWRTDGTPAGTARAATEGVPEPYNSYNPLMTFIGTVNASAVYVTRDKIGWGLFAVDAQGGAPTVLSRLVTRASRGTNAPDGSLVFSDGATYNGSIWRTDGTPEGTRRIVWPIGSSDVFTVGGSVFFMGMTSKGSGLCLVNGAPEGEFLLAAGTSGFAPLIAGNTLIFNNAVVVTDGTANGTRIVVRAALSNARLAGTLAGRTYFTAGYPNATLWETDGTAAGTHEASLVTDRIAGVTQISGAVAGNQLFLLVTHEGKRSLYVSDGGPAREILNVRNDSPGFVFGGRFYFANDDGIHGSEPWVSDGTSAGTFMVTDLDPGAASGWRGIGSVRPDGIVLGASGWNSGTEPWFMTGEPGRAWRLADIVPGGQPIDSDPSLLRSDGERLFFTAKVGATEVAGVSNGTSLGTSTTPIASFARSVDAAALGGHYFISTSRSPSGGAGGPLLATDGTATGTRKVHDLPLTTPLPFRNGVIFIARDDDSNAGVPWFSDGAVAGTRMLPKRGEANDRPYRLFVTGDQAWYARGSRLWRTDGTEAGTIEMPVHPSRTGDVVSIVRIGTRTWFIEAWTGDDPGPSKLWCSDDSNAGMHVVQTFDYSIQLPRPTHLGGVGNVALFFYRRQLYRSDGTVSGTYELPVIADVYDCAPGFRALGKSVVFAGAPNGGGYVLWRTDGTVAGTLVLFESTNQHFACGQEPAVAGDLVYFPGTDGAHGEEPWVSDGTTGGTHMVDDVAPLSAGSYPREFTVAGTRVFFTAYLPGYRRELWAIGPDVPPAKRHSARH